MTTQDPERRAPEVRLTDETINYLKQQIAQAVAEGLAQTMTPEVARRFWQTGFDVLAGQAREGAGTFVLSGLWKGVKTLMWIGGVSLAVYATGGWAALKGFLAVVFTKGA